MRTRPDPTAKMHKFAGMISCMLNIPSREPRTVIHRSASESAPIRWCRQSGIRSMGLTTSPELESASAWSISSSW